MAQDSKQSWEIEQRLQELTQIKAEMKPIEGDFAAAWSFTSLEAFEEQLQKEAKAARLVENKYALEISLTGDPVNDHAVNIKFFGSLLVYAQDVLNAIAYSLTGGRQTRRNLIPRNRLALAATGPGSFAASFTLPETVEQETLPLDLPEAETPLGLLSALLDGTIDIEDNSEVLTNPQVKAKYSQLISLLARDGASVSVYTQSNPMGVKLSAKEARDRREWLELLRSTVEEKTLSGTLVGGNIETGRFEIKSDQTTIRGRASDYATKQIRNIHLGAEVTATVEVTTATHEESNFIPKTSYFLKSIRVIEEPALFDLADDASQKRIA